MAYDTDNNFPVSGVSGEAMIATDYSASDQSHYQVMKLAFGSASTPTRVASGDANALPVKIENASAISISGSVTLDTGAAVTIANGVTLLGGTFNSRKLSAVGGVSLNGGITQGGASGGSYDSGFDSIRVVGISGAFPVSVVGTAFDVRKLTAIGSNTASAMTGGGAFGDSSIDTLRVIGFSGAYPVETLLFGLTGVSAGGSYAFSKNHRIPFKVNDIGSLSVNIETFPTTSALPVTVNTAAYVNGGTLTSSGFSTRILRATRAASPVDTAALIETDLVVEANAEDTVRVVGFSGAYPVESLLFGITNQSDKSSRRPVTVDNDGYLRVSVAVGTIGVTATVTGVTLGGAMTISGISLGIGNGISYLSAPNPIALTGGYNQVLQVQGYKYGWTGGGTGMGVNAIPITTEVTGPLYVQNASGTSLAVNGTISFSNTSIAVTNSALTSLGTAITGSGTDTAVRMSADSTLSGSLTNTANALSGLCGAVKTLSDVFVNGGGNNVIADMGGGARAIKVKVEDVVQPSSVTAGRVELSTTEGTQLPAFTLESGVNLRSDLRNTTQTIFVSNTAVGASGGLGFPLYNGDQIFIETDNLNKIFVASTPAGATLYYIGS